VEFPEVSHLSYKAYGPPSCLGEEVHVDYWREKSEPIKGGAAGRGPPPPEVPKMSAQSAADINLSSLDDVESAAESDGKTKMAFAKMLVPSDLRDCFLFTDRDFDVQDDNESEAGMGMTRSASFDNFDAPEDSNSRMGSSESQRSPKGGAIQHSLSEADSDGSVVSRSNSRKSDRNKSKSRSGRSTSVTPKAESAGAKKRGGKKSIKDMSNTGGSVGSNVSS